MTIVPGTGDEPLISELTDEELIRERNEYNEMLEAAFMVDSGKYDVIATFVKEIEAEMNRREHEGPPWLAE